MGHQIVKQPNGLLAIFSDGVNAWLRWDMTPHDVTEYYAERAAQSARESAARTVHKVMTDRPREAYYQFTQTFAELNAVAKASGSEVLDGPVDEDVLRRYAELDRQEAERQDRIDNHLIFGAGQDG